MKRRLSKQVNCYPFGLRALKALRRRRRFIKRRVNRALNKKAFRTYKQRTFQIVKRYLSPQLTNRQFKKLFKSNSRFRTTLSQVLQLEQRLDMLVYRLYMLPHIAVARELIMKKFILLNNRVMTDPLVFVKENDLIGPSDAKSWSFLYKNMLGVTASYKKYLNRVFRRYSYPFVNKSFKQPKLSGFRKEAYKVYSDFLERIKASNSNKGQGSKLKPIYFKKKRRLRTKRSVRAIYNVHYLFRKRTLKNYRGRLQPRTQKVGLSLNKRIKDNFKLIGKSLKQKRLTDLKAKRRMFRRRRRKSFKKKFNNLYPLFKHYQQLKGVSFSSNTKIDLLFDKKRKRLQTYTTTKGYVMAQRSKVYSFSNQPVKKVIMRIKRKYLRINGFYRKLNGSIIKINLNKKTYSPIRIRYKKIDLRFKQRPIPYYFSDFNMNSLEFTVPGDVDLLTFPYKTPFDYKRLAYAF